MRSWLAKHKRKRKAFLLFFCAWAVSCLLNYAQAPELQKPVISPAGTGTPPMEIVCVDPTPGAKKVFTATGGTFESLEDPPWTKIGDPYYVWTYNTLIGRPASEAKPSPGDPSADGSILEMKVDQPGKTLIKVRLNQDWEKYDSGKRIVKPTDSPSSDEVLFVVLKVELLTAATTFKRDEIFDVELKVTPALPVAKKFKLSLSKGDKKLDFGARQNVQVYDFGDGTKSFTQNVDGSQMSETDYRVTLQANQESVKFKTVINKEQTAIRIKAEMEDDPKYFGETEDIGIAKRIRQYAEKEGAKKEDELFNARVNQFDAEFESAAALWPDWGYGDGLGKYFFKDGAGHYSSELLKAVAFRESQMNASEAGKNSTPADIMQVDGGQRVTRTMNEGGELDWNGRATRVPIVDRKGDTILVFLVDETPRNPAPDNHAGVGMLYGLPQNQPPGPANVNSEANSIKWAVRELLFKQYDLKTILKSIQPRGQGRTSVAIDPPALLSLEATLDRYGPSSERGVYGHAVIRLVNEGVMARRHAVQFVWPILTNHKARHGL